jgi:hypothetical protein
MAEFCTKCTPELYGADTTPDINIQEIAKSLEPETYAMCMCEGCGLAAIGLMADGEILLAMPTGEIAENQEGIPVKWINLDEFMALPSQI